MLFLGDHLIVTRLMSGTGARLFFAEFFQRPCLFRTKQHISNRTICKIASFLRNRKRNGKFNRTQILSEAQKRPKSTKTICTCY